MEPLVSVCIPAYNSACYIKGTIESILEQTYTNIEVIVVDDKSTDNTLQVVRNIEDKRIKIYENESNLGMVGNWNHCVELATGEFVKLVCADDLIDNEAIEIEAKALQENPTAVLVESDTRLIDINGKMTGTFKRYPKNGLVDGKKIAKISLMFNNFFGAPVNNMFRKSAFEKVCGFDKSFTYILDFDFWVNLACIGDVYIIHKTLNSFMIRNDSNTGKMINQEREIYVDEHRKLVTKYALSGKLSISKFEIEISVFNRKMRNFLIGIYLKIFAK